jgi:hypothetical protein
VSGGAGRERDLPSWGFGARLEMGLVALSPGWVALFSRSPINRSKSMTNTYGMAKESYVLPSKSLDSIGFRRNLILLVMKKKTASYIIGRITVRSPNCAEDYKDVQCKAESRGTSITRLNMNDEAEVIQVVSGP